MRKVSYKLGHFLNNRIRRAVGSFSLIFLLFSISPAFAADSLHFDVQAENNGGLTSKELTVRVVVFNAGGSAIRVELMSARYEVTLYVYNEKGKLVKPTRLMPEFCSAGCTNALSFRPGAKFVPTQLINGAYTEWIPLAAWGYPNLPAGSYRIIARPGYNMGGSADVKSDLTQDNNFASASSNEVTVTIR